MNLSSFGASLNVAVIGTSGGIGKAMLKHLENDPAVTSVFAFSRSDSVPSDDKTQWSRIDILEEDSIAACAERATVNATLNLVLVTTGVLHDAGNIQPEKSWRDLNRRTLQEVYAINAIGPALVAKHFLPGLTRQRKSVFAALSARVGSIADNRLGGWLAYRSSKAALNMTIRTLAIELARRNPQAYCVALHPGTVDTSLSAPFQANVPADRLFTPDYAAEKLLQVIDQLEPGHTGTFLAWDGQDIPF